MSCKFTYRGTSRYASTDNLPSLSNFMIPGKTLPTNWKLSPPAPRVDLAKLETLDDPDWGCYHTAFHPNGFRRGMSYIKYYIPRKVPDQIRFVEQWVAPGWDCTPSGSAERTTAKANWTNELIQFAADLSLPVQENFWPPPGVKTSLGSIVATLAFSARQEEARKNGQSNWRELPDDGYLPEVGPGLFRNAMINVTLSMSTEMKKRLPKDGVRWLYMRSEVKKLEGSRMDLEVLLFDDSMDLVAISHQVAWIVTGVEKTQRSSSL
ncbi:hypothetical protein CC78DRAFT_361607 [Lojkania enalia]|uniref:Acyl-CoA thioesterase-like C-terminal domain-containing protein n=1 Tax=Lojkania enalia TaxID=147567 RepID=A0A9P4N701_9PLEO|nr:hypothetical protein CC78DRAFT_361607 [Didymosphaeria enalia]